MGPWATANYCRAGIKSLRGTLSNSLSNSVFFSYFPVSTPNLSSILSFFPITLSSIFLQLLIFLFSLSSPSCYPSFLRSVTFFFSLSPLLVSGLHKLSLSFLTVSLYNLVYLFLLCPFSPPVQFSPLIFSLVPLSFSLSFSSCITFLFSFPF